MTTDHVTNWQPKFKAMSKAGNGMADFSRGNREALTQSAQAYVAGVQGFSRLYLATVQELTQQTVENAKAVAAAKTSQDVLAVQAGLTRTSIERIFREGLKRQQAAQEMMEQVSAPLMQRMAAAGAARQTELTQAA